MWLWQYGALEHRLTSYLSWNRTRTGWFFFNFCCDLFDSNGFCLFHWRLLCLLYGNISVVQLCVWMVWVESSLNQSCRSYLCYYFVMVIWRLKHWILFLVFDFIWFDFRSSTYESFWMCLPYSLLCFCDIIIIITFSVLTLEGVYTHTIKTVLFIDLNINLPAVKLFKKKTSHMMLRFNFYTNIN